MTASVPPDREAVDWIKNEFKRARERSGLLPLKYKPVTTKARIATR